MNDSYNSLVECIHQNLGLEFASSHSFFSSIALSWPYGRAFNTCFERHNYCADVHYIYPGPCVKNYFGNEWLSVKLFHIFDEIRFRYSFHEIWLPPLGSILFLILLMWLLSVVENLHKEMEILVKKYPSLKIIPYNFIKTISCVILVLLIIPVFITVLCYFPGFFLAINMLLAFLIFGCLAASGLFVLETIYVCIVKLLCCIPLWNLIELIYSGN